MRKVLTGIIALLVYPGFALALYGAWAADYGFLVGVLGMSPGVLPGILAVVGIPACPLTSIWLGVANGAWWPLIYLVGGFLWLLLMGVIASKVAPEESN